MPNAPLNLLIKKNVLILALLLACSCLIHAQVEPVVDANNNFGIDAYHKLSNEPDILISPLSISSAMAMTYMGAGGETKTEIERVFHFPADDQLNKGFLDLSNILNQPYPKTTIGIANKLYAGSRRIEMNPEFVNKNKRYYGAGLQTLNFNDKKSASDTINNWVAKQTNDKIKNLIDDDFISDDMVLILINAIYFKSEWMHTFDAKLTEPGKFKNQNNTKIDVSFMVDGKNRYRGYENEYFQMVRIPFVRDEFSFMILLPKQSMEDLEENFTNENYNSWMNDFDHQTVFTKIKIPKFKGTYRMELADQLAQMGMPTSFNGGADFRGMGNANGAIMLSKVVHQTYIEVNEQGAEAAGATAIGAVARSAPPPPKEFIADHPFIYLITHKKTNTILFVGKVSNPKF